MIPPDGSCALYYSYVVYDEYRRVTKQQRQCSGRSFVKAFLVGLFLRMIAPDDMTLTDTSTVSRQIVRTTDFETVPGAGTTTTGLVVGTGTNAVTINDTALQTQVAHGTGAGQLQYSSSLQGAPTSDGTGTSLILTRDFTNASGGTITIQEIGIMSGMTDSASSVRNFLMARDLQTIALTNGALVTLNYELRTIV